MSSNKKLQLINQSLSPKVDKNIKIQFRKTINFERKYQLQNNPYKVKAKNSIGKSPMSLITKLEI